MYNYELLTKNSKMELLEKALTMAIETNDWETAEEYLYNIKWLFEKMKPEAEKYFGKEMDDIVQLSKDNE